MERYKIALSAGDGIGVELIRQVKKLFIALESRYDIRFELTEIRTCGPAIDAYDISRTALYPGNNQDGGLLYWLPK